MPPEPAEDNWPSALTGRTARLAAQLAQWERRTVRLPELWTLYEAADPASGGALERRALLADTLTELELAGLLRSSATTDKSAAPPLPTQVTLPAGQASPSAAALARSIIWRPELAWVSAAPRLTVPQVQLLAKVNTWLRDRGRDDDRVPLRERLLEILGHEKALDRAVGSGLFAPDRLTLTLLRTFRSHPPLPAVRVGTGSVLLVVENEDTFTTLLESVRRDAQQVGVVAWGAGGAFEASVRSIAELDPPVSEVRYFGDLDFDGLRIPANASRTAAIEKLPPIRPATALYRYMLQVGVPQPGSAVPDKSALAAVIEWFDTAGEPLDGPTRQTVADLLSSGARVPQEAVGTKELAAGWPGPR